MEILVLGLSFHEAPVELRERLAFQPDDLPPALARLRAAAQEGVVLSTCNRTEVYAVVADADEGRRALVRFLSESRGVPAADFEPALRERRQQEAVRHLFRVAAGLDSMVVGEPQVLGQVRDAYETARREGATGPVLSRLFQQALEVGKRARAETDVARSAVSVSYAAVELARSILGSLAERTILLVGSGRMGELAARTLAEQGASQVLVTSRHFERARALAERLGGEPVLFSELEQQLVRADVVISSTSAPHQVIDRRDVAQALPARGDRPLFLIDIAVPRDVDPAVRSLPNVYLYDVDDLEAVCRVNLEARRAESTKIEALIAEEVPRFMAWWDSLDLTPTIAALVTHAERIRQAELERALSRLSTLSDREREVVQALSVAIVNKLLHDPIVRLKERGNGLDGRLLAPAVHELFRLERRAS